MTASATIHAQIPSGSASVDLTVAGVFDGAPPKAAIVVATNGVAAAGAGQWDNAWPAQGLITASAQVGMGAGSADAIPQGASKRGYKTGVLLFGKNGQGTVMYEYTGTLLSNGITLTRVSNNGNDLFVHVLLIGGDDVQASLMLERSAGPVQAIGFEPNCLVAMSVFNTTSGFDDNDFTFGNGVVVENSQGTKQNALTLYDRRGADPTEVTAVAANTRFMVDVNSGGIANSLQHTGFAASAGGEHTFTGTLGANKWHGLYLRFDHDQFDVKEWLTPTGPGLSPVGVPLHFVPQTAWASTIYDLTAWSLTAVTSNVGSINNMMADSGSRAGSDSSSIRDGLFATETGRRASITNWRALNDNIATGFVGTPFVSSPAAPKSVIVVPSSADTLAVVSWMLAIGKGRAIVQYGSLDVDAIKYGTLDVDKVYYGSSEL